VIPVPHGASGPHPVRSGAGFQYTGGRGGSGLHPNVSGVRIMDPTPPKGPSPGYPHGYVNYFNAAKPTAQSVHPYTGRTLSKGDPYWHIPIT
jgi:hypothetical protein